MCRGPVGLGANRTLTLSDIVFVLEAQNYYKWSGKGIEEAIFGLIGISARILSLELYLFYTIFVREED